MSFFAYICAAVVFSINGVLIREFKKYDLIAGYNTLSVSDKVTIDIETYANIMGIVFYSLALISIVVAFLQKYQMVSHKLATIIWALALGIGIGIIVFSGHSSITIKIIATIVIFAVISICIFKGK